MRVRIRRLRVSPELPAGLLPAWQQVPSYKLGSGILAFIRCPRGHWGAIGESGGQSKHRIQLATLTGGTKVMMVTGFLGIVEPSVICPAPGCGWHEWVELEDWNELAPKPMKPEAVEAIVVHHSQESGMQPVGDIEDKHRRPKVRIHPSLDKSGEGWPGIGYHILVDAAGTEHEGMPIQFRGTHCPGWNYRSVAVCLLGNFDVTKPTAPQLDTATKVLRRLLSAFPKAKILGHRAAMIEAGEDPDFPAPPRTCPGGGGQWLRDLESRVRSQDPEVAPDALYT